MATFAAQIEALSGSISDVAEVNVWLEDGAKSVIHKIIRLDPSQIKRFTDSVGMATGTGGLSLDGYIHIDKVYHKVNACTQIDADLRFKAADPDSFYVATDVHPVYYIHDNILYVLPSPGTMDTAASVIATKTVATTDEAIADFPDELEPLVVLFASARNVQSKLVDSTLPSDPIEVVAPLIGDFSDVAESFPTYGVVPGVVLPTAPSDANVDFSDVGATPTFSVPIAAVLPVLDLGDDISISAFSQSATAPTAPSGTVPDVVVADLITAPSFITPTLTLTDVESIDDLVLPVPPASITLATTSETLPTYTPIAVVTLPSVLAAANVDFGDVPSLPTFAFSKVLTMPAPPTILTTNTKTLTDAAEVAGVDLPTLVLEEPPVLTSGDFSSITAPSSPSAPSFTTPSVTLGTAPSYVGPTKTLNITTAMGTITTQIETDEELQMAVAKINQVAQAVNDFNSEVQDALNRFNDDNVEYQAELQASVEEARLTTSQESVEYQGTIQKYQADVSAYVASVNAEVSKFTTNQTQQLINVWVAQNQQLIAEYQSDVGAIIQKYSQEIVSKSNLTSAEVAVYGAELSRLSLINQSNIALFETSSGSSLQEFASNLNESIQVFTAGIQAWKSEVDKAMATYQSETGYDVAVYQQTVRASIDKQVQDVNNENTEYQAGIGKYLTELRSVVESNTVAISNRNTELEKYVAELNGVLQKWGLEEVQGKQARWIAERTTDVSKYQSDIQNALASFNKDNIKYQADIQTKIVNVQNELAADVENVRSELTNYAAQIESYRTDVNTELQEYLSKEVQSVLQAWVETRRNLLNEFQIKSGSALEEYSIRLQEKVATFTSDLQTWQGLIQKAITTYQAETGYDLGLYKTSVDAAVALVATAIQNSTTEFQANLGKYSLDLQRVSEVNNRTLGKYGQELQKYQIAIGGELQKFNAVLSKRQLQYSWYAEQFVRLMSEYNSGFAMYGKE